MKVVQPEVGKCTFQDGVCHHVDFEKLLPFRYYSIDRHQNQWKHCDFDLERIGDVRNA